MNGRRAYILLLFAATLVVLAQALTPLAAIQSADQSATVVSLAAGDHSTASHASEVSSPGTDQAQPAILLPVDQQFGEVPIALGSRLCVTASGGVISRESSRASLAPAHCRWHVMNCVWRC